MRRRALLLIISLVVVTPAFAQAAKGPSDEERAKVYLTDKQAAQRSFQQGLQANGRGRDVAAMSAGVRAAHPARGRALKHSAATDQAIVDAITPTSRWSLPRSASATATCKAHAARA